MHEPETPPKTEEAYLKPLCLLVLAGIDEAADHASSILGGDLGNLGASIRNSRAKLSQHLSLIGHNACHLAVSTNLQQGGVCLGGH